MQLETVQSVCIWHSSLQTKIENAFVLGSLPAVKLMIQRRRKSNCYLWNIVLGRQSLCRQQQIHCIIIIIIGRYSSFIVVSSIAGRLYVKIPTLSVNSGVQSFTPCIGPPTVHILWILNSLVLWQRLWYMIILVVNTVHYSRRRSKRGII